MPHQPASWARLSLRWKLVVLNAAVVAAAGAAVIMLVHHVAVPSIDTVMHDAQSAPTHDMAQSAYDDAVNRQVIPAVVIACLGAIALTLLVVSFSLRPLRAVEAATRRIAAGDLGVRIASRRRDEIGDVARCVDDLSTQLGRLEDLRRRTADDVAHELRTPLQNVLGLVEAMRDGVLGSDEANLDRVRTEVLRLTALVDDLRSLADAGTARHHLQRRSVSLVALAREVTRGFDAELTARSLQAQVLVPDGVAPDVLVDPGRIAQVVRNLVGNAVRYARPGTVIEILVRSAGHSRTRVEVRDHGEEIPDSVIPFIFERFVRADPSRDRGSGGAGIGLSIVRELVEAHGGEVGATSGEGCVSVWFEIPGDAQDGPRDGVRSGAGAPAGAV